MRARMLFTRRSLGTCVRHTGPFSGKAPLYLSIRCCATTSSVSLTHSSTVPQSNVSLSYTCRLLDTICGADQPTFVKRKRIQGAVRKMEAGIVDSFAAASSTVSPAEKQKLLRRWLQSLSHSVEYMPRLESCGADDATEPERFSSRSPRRSRHTSAGDAETWSGASPFFSLQTSDVLCLCLRECVMNVVDTQPELLQELLEYAVVLELGDAEVLQHMLHALTKTDVCRRRTAAEVVQLLHYISLAAKRCKLPAPPLDRLLSVLSGATLTARESLMVLCALHRIPTVHAGDVVTSVSRKAAAQASTYNVKDVVYGLEISALLAGCNVAYAAAVLDRAGVLAPSMTPRQLGSVCKYVALLNTTRRQNTLAYSCGAELRRLLPLLVERAEQLLGQFHLRDSRNVLRCFREHKVRHSLIFSRLTPLAEDS
ncbi:hypothetical protein ABB37_03576 [Leptomonas pyrrhocoris]|uniref:Uncharacterized protein n=1 Tax=Leptomonas pyrrhocoris TaxID=157538 RepID=A0A0M9G582_LEPPY|nr:hypothetical protein ABB37_03576 [Leptomonas pyrrhocoris]KPA82533.1 hypothetical protein ABB37_03576 [Leptomonas pyrrhocoris]|eukprot:XP_015660972.1 hypothetical protein ABB37_03576 [Leptomonas pyrrhocoris]